MIVLEEIPRSRASEFWPLHWEYLNRDIFGYGFPEEDRAYFQSEDYRSVLERFMDRVPDRHHMVYFVRDGIRIGCTQYIIYKSEDGKCLILDFWVFPEYRGNGTGHACFEALARCAEADGAAWYQINCDRENARRFWISLGFADDGIDEYGDPLMKKTP